jgi:O-antigen/teichoic acid export membrane protein
MTPTSLQGAPDRRPPQRRTKALIALLFLLPLLVLFWEVVAGGRTLVPYDALVSDPAFRPLLAAEGIARPQNGLLADLVLQNVVWKEFLRDALLRGLAPLWNPLIFGGVPFLAAAQSSPFYPATLLHVVTTPDRAFGLGAVLNLWIAACAMFAFGRSLRLGRGPAAIMGLTWSLSSLLVVNTVFPMIQAAMAWTPLLLAGVESTARAIERRPGPLLPTGRTAAWWLTLAGCTALIALAGHPEMLYYAGLTAVAYTVFRGVVVARRVHAGAGTRLVAWVGAAGATGLLVAAIQLVPLGELAASSSRSEAAYETAVGHSFSIRQAFSFVLPNVFGNPAHHRYFDLTTRSIRTLDTNAMWGTTWIDGSGWTPTKNYVEAAAYVGILPLLLAVIGILGSPRRERWFFGGLGLIAASFAFGLPTYRLLYVLPGIEQLRTPFRWTFPLLLAVTVLAGLGADRLSWRVPSRSARIAALVAATFGAAALGILATAWLYPQRWVSIMSTVAEAVPGADTVALAAFPDMGAFAGYAYLQSVHGAAFLLLGGLTVALLVRSRGAGIAWYTACALAAADLLLASRGFLPAVDPDLSTLKPQSVSIVQDAVDVKWGRVVGFGDGKALWPNSLMRFGVPDLRGYDSLIPAWTAESISRIEDQSDWLQYNRIGDLTEPASLNHPLLRALAGRYIVSGTTLDVPGLIELHDGAVKVYENSAALPRAWVVPQTKVITDRAQLLEELATFDPEAEVLLEEVPDDRLWTLQAPGRQRPGPARVSRDTGNELILDVYSSGSAMLVISDAWFPGWRAWVETATESGRSETEVPVFRANGMLRAVPIPAGQSFVRMDYFPMSIKIGLYGSFLGILLMGLAAAYALWARFVGAGRTDALGRVAQNSIGPMAIALVNKAVDFAFAMLMLRLLGPEDAGKYYTAVTIIAFAEIFTNFGLNLFTTREVARRPGEAPVFLAQTSLLRLVLWLLALPGLLGYVAFRAATGSPLAPDTLLAVGLLVVALVPGNLNSALSSVFQAFEKMMIPATVTIVSNLLRVSLGALVLLGGWGFIGLAAVAIAVNWVTFAVLGTLLLREGVRPALEWRPGMARTMALTSLPFMLNHLLQTVFFKVDVLLLSQMRGDQVVGWYSAAYRWVDALLIIPGYFTLALFPLMSRQASSDREALRGAYVVALRWLVSLALPIAMATTVLASDLIRVLAGEEYLPAGAIALRIMIWFLPLSFANGLTQYVLLALDRQRLITPAFAVAVTFNLVANMWAIPIYGYQGAAVVTILSEVVLLVPFSLGIRDLGAPPLVALIWRPALATSVMGLVLVGLASGNVPPIAGAAGATIVYLGALRVFGGITAHDTHLLRRLFGQR